MLSSEFRREREGGEGAGKRERGLHSMNKNREKQMPPLQASLY